MNNYKTIQKKLELYFINPFSAQEFFLLLFVNLFLSEMSLKVLKRLTSGNKEKFIKFIKTL